MPAADVAARMVSALALTIPELDTSVGTPARKILDAVAEEIAESEVDKYLLDHMFDVDAKTGADLDSFVAVFGFARLPAQRATGVLTYSRVSPADQDYPIPAGSQATTTTDSPVQFATVVPAVLQRGQTSVDVPAQAVLGGQLGNLAANVLVGMATPVSGPTAVTNTSPTAGGVDPETDAALLTRFKATVFRGLAGTADMFLATALEDTTPDDATDGVAVRAKVLGASARWREQVQIQPDGTATSSIPAANAKYVFAGTQFLGPDLDAGSILTPGVHYTMDAVVPPVVHSVGSALPTGSVYDLDFEYASAASRNDPANGITNRVDVWVDGSRPVQATETLFFRTNPFSSDSSSAIYTGKFVRGDTAGTHPTAGNHFVPLAYGPLVTVPATLVVGGTTYALNTDYWLVHDDTAFGYGPTSLFGLEWKASSAPAGGAEIDAVYTYNALPGDVEARIRRWALVTTDARAHQAKRVYLRLNLAVVFSRGYDPAAVISDVQDAVAQLLSGRDFDAAVEVSDLIQAAHSVVGVDNVRFLTSNEPLSGGRYALEVVTADGTHISYSTTGSSPARATDLQLGDNQVPVLHDVAYSLRAANSFRTGS